MTIKPTTYWIGGSILTVALVYGLWALRPLWIKGETTGDSSPPNPEHIFNFSDGSSIKIYEIQRGTIAHTFPVSSSTSTMWGGMSGSSSGSSGDGNFEVSHRTSGSELSELSFNSNSDALLVEFRFCEYADISSFPWVVADSHRELKTINGSSTSSKPHDWTIEQMVDNTYTGITPDFLIQILDSDGNWVTGNIATPSDEDPWLRSVVGFGAWPSTESELEFRVIRKGFKPREFTLDNPDVRLPEPWTSKPLPSVVEEPNYTLTMETVEQSRSKLWGVMVTPKLSIKSKSEGMEKSYNVHISDLETHTGETPDPHTHQQFPVDPAVEKIKVTAQVTASDHYPYLRDSAVIFAKATVADDGSVGEVEITNKRLGFTKIEATKINKSSQLKFEITGVWDNARAEADAAREVGNWVQKLPRVYLDDDTIPAGSTSNSGGSSRGNGDRTEFTSQIRFTPKEALTPGQTLFLGYVQPPPPALHEFIIDRADFSPLTENDD